MTLHCSFFTGCGDARGTYNNVLANYEIVIRRAYKHRKHSEKHEANYAPVQWERTHGPLVKHSRLAVCVSENNEQKSTLGHTGFYAKLCKSCNRVSWVTELRAFETSSDRYKHDLLSEIWIKIRKMYFPGTQTMRVSSPSNQITMLFALYIKNEIFCNS